MITNLSPELKSHIEEYIDEIEQNRINQSILKCPLNVLDDYVHVLKQIDIEPRIELKTYIDIACCIGAKIEYGNCCNIEVRSPEDVSYEFETDTTSLLDWDKLQEDLICICPYHYVQAVISHEFFGLPRRTIKVSLHPLAEFRF